ncbi:MAG: hypothetical protein VX653_00305 [Candidatus Thermoplasmatota archaeon]|nr:hypothetical protein [Candidatus Thermoplasmatota archaeon]
MKRTGWLLLTMVLGLLATPMAMAHDQKEYTVILGSQGATPSSIDDGILVETDSIFFRNHDSRTNASHRILIDADADGAFQEVDDFDTGWMETSCELNETGHKVDDSCQTSATVLLAPENGLLPGNISMMHQLAIDGTVTDTPFYAVFSIDDHSQQTTPNPTAPETQTEGDDSESLLRGIAVIAAGVSILLASRLISPRSNN